MRKSLELAQQVGRAVRRPAKVPVQATRQHRAGFALLLLCAWLLLGWAPPLDWDEDARWELQNDSRRYRLDSTLSELGLTENADEMTILPNGLLVRHRERRAVNLTVLKGEWSVLRNDQVLGKVGESLEDWQSRLGAPRKIFVNPEKAGVIYYYRASLVDLGLLVADGRVLSVMFVEPGYLESALERSGYRTK